ncbi:Glutathione synthase [Spraguea lophii 42_110]|uniref:Glutathione synthase n=1 Tax=Spraguea lophii (strain 42_110) TaxID=1358809 RepID=S7W820_SPRLO|nr:Glutathione synthase [Spraguea lophii 42_110]
MHRDLSTREPEQKNSKVKTKKDFKIFSPQSFAETCKEYRIFNTLRITEKPTKFPLEKYFEVKKLQPTVNKLVDNLSIEIKENINIIREIVVDAINAKIENKLDIHNSLENKINNSNLSTSLKKILNYNIKDKTFILFILMVSSKKYSNDKLNITFLRTDYILDINNVMKQIEINSIALANYAFAENLYKVHNTFNKTLESIGGEEVTNMLVKCKNIYERRYKNMINKNKSLIQNYTIKDDDDIKECITKENKERNSIDTIVLMIDNNDDNMIDKILLQERCHNKGMVLITVKIEDMMENCTFVRNNNIFCIRCLNPNDFFEENELFLYKEFFDFRKKCNHKNNITNDHNHHNPESNKDDILVFYKSQPISILYYRYFYNFTHYTTPIIIFRRILESTSSISLPNIQTQISTLKTISSILEEEDLKRYLSNDETQEYQHSLVKYLLNDKKHNDDYIKKSNVEGGGNVKELNEDYNKTNEYKNNKIYSNTDLIDILDNNFTNNIFSMEKIIGKTFKNNFINEEEIEIISEIGVAGYNIKGEYTDISYVVKTKNKDSIECGITKGYGGLDTIADI